MAAPDRQALVTSLVLAPLGAPLLPQELQLDPVNDVQAGLQRYYKYVPIKAAMAATITSLWVLTHNYADIISQYDPANPGDYFYVGIVHAAVRAQIGQNAFNQNLLGLNVGVPIADPMQNLEMATMVDISTGDPYFEEDEVRQQVRWTFGGSGNFSVIYGLGNWNLSSVPWRHLDLIAKLIGSVYYKRLLAIRTTGSFSNTDFKIDASQLQKVYDANEKEAVDYLNTAGLLAVTVG